MTLSASSILCVALVGVAQSASAHTPAATKLSAARVAELSACVDQGLAHHSLGKDACAPLVGSPGVVRDPVTGRVIVSERAGDRMAECVDQQHEEGTDGAANVCRDFVRRR